MSTLTSVNYLYIVHLNFGLLLGKASSCQVLVSMSISLITLFRFLRMRRYFFQLSLS